MLRFSTLLALATAFFVQCRALTPAPGAAVTPGQLSSSGDLPVHRRAVLRTVSTTSELTAAISTGTTIELLTGFTLTASVIISGGTNSLIIDGKSFTINGNGLYRHFSISGASTSVSIKNAVLHNGASGTNGGAVLVGTGAMLAMSGCTLSSNKAVGGKGGGLCAGYDTGTSGITLTLTSCTFTGNSVSGNGVPNGYGGGLFIGTGVTVTITDCAFASNTGAHYGGGIAQYAASTATLTRVTFSSNSAFTYGGGYYNNGGATCISSLISCTFTANTATALGRGGGMYIAVNAGVSFTNYKFENNIASSAFGPDLYRGSSSATLTSGCSETVNFGTGHLWCYNCAKDLPGDLELADCKTNVSASTVSSKSTFENAIITDNTITLSLGFTVASEIVILDVTGLTIEGAGETITGASSCRVFFISNIGTEVSINNLVLSNGYASYLSYSGQYGGAVYVGGGATIVMVGCTFVNSGSASGFGGGLSLGKTTGTSGITATLTDCVFNANSASNGYGGGLFIGTGVTVTITDCAFASNTGASSGGGIAQIATSSSTLTRITFTSNSASVSGGGMYISGTTSTISRCIFTSNTASSGGSGGGLYVGSSAVVSLVDFMFVSNVASALNGPDLYRGSSLVALSRTTTCEGTDENFGTGHMWCYNCANDKDYPSVWDLAGCKAIVTSSTVNSQTGLENSLVTGNTITLSSGFTVSSEIVILDITAITIDGAGYTISGANTRRIFYIANTGTHVTMTNLVLSKGFAQSTSYAGFYGGAMFVGSGATIVIIGCTIEDNHVFGNGYGGGICLGNMLTSGITATFTDSTFTLNSVSGGGYGGALYVGEGVALAVEDSDFTTNTGAGFGGGVAQTTSLKTTFTRVTFKSNYALLMGGGMYLLGRTLFSSCAFTTNTATNSGSGGGLYVGSSGTVQVEGSSFSGNIASTNNGQDVYRSSGTFKVTSMCNAGYFNAGSGTLRLPTAYPGTYPADLTGECSVCAAGLHSCCGARSCVSSPVCTGQEICHGSPEPSPVPSISPVPSASPSFAPSPKPTSQPTPSPTLYCPAGKYYSVGTRFCNDCAPGKFSSVLTDGQSAPSECTFCKAGEYAEFEGTEICLKCRRGKLSTPDRTYCDDCQPGQYAFNKTECINCGNGDFAPLPQTGSCLTCAPGSHTNNVTGATTCNLCNGGTFSPGATATCSVCDAGRYSPSGQASCKQCPIGFVTATAGSESCSACSVGYFAASAGSTLCAGCALGRHQGASGQGACLDCEAGKYAEAVATASCASCAAGTYGLVKAVACLACVPGKFQARTSQIECNDCNAGAFSSSSGALSCTECSAGRFVAHVGATDCSVCGKGFYQYRTGQSFCDECAENTHADKEGSVVCTDCAVGYFAEAGSASCNLADVGYFIKPKFDETTREWVNGDSSGLCPSQASCWGYLELPRPRANYWVDRKSLEFVGVVYLCARSTCLGAVNKGATTTSASASVGGANESSCWSAAAYEPRSAWAALACDSAALLCTPGSTGYLCGSCEDGYTFSSALASCVQCDSGDHTVPLVVLATVSVALLCIAALYFAGVRPPRAVSRHVVYRSLAKLDKGSLQVCWATYQIVCTIAWNLSVQFPPPFGLFLSFLSFLQLDFLSLDCVSGKNSFFSRLYVVSLCPILAAAAILVAFVVRLLTESSTAEHRTHLTSQHASSFLLLSYLVLPACSMVQFQALDCVTLPHDGTSFLRIDSGIDCSSISYAKFKLVTTFFVFLYQSIPPLWFMLLWRKRSQLNPPMADNRLAEFVRDNDPKLNTLRFLFGAYNPQHYYFECIEMYRRIFFIGVLPLVSSNTGRRASFGFVVALISYVFYREVEPFSRRSTNLVAYIAQFSIMLTFGAAVAIDTNLSRGANPLAFGCFLVIINMAIIVMTVWLGFSRFADEQKKKRAEMRNQAQTIEYAVEFSIEKFSTTFEEIRKTSVPPSHALLFW